MFSRETHFLVACDICNMIDSLNVVGKYKYLLENSVCLESTKKHTSVEEGV